MTSRMRGLLAALSLMATVRGDWTVGDTGVDHMYNDIINFQMKTNTTLECYNACADQDGCAGWVVVPTGNCGSVATCFLKSLMGNLTLNPCRISGVMPSALLPSAYTPVRVGQVQPEGWLSTELNIQANGLSGYLFYFWPDIQSSVWLGGDQDGGLHERGPYFLNGIVPLAFQTKNANITYQMQTYINHILAGQAPSGWLGPDDLSTDGNEYWSRFNVIQSFIQYWEPTQDSRIMPALFAYLKEARNRMLTGPPLNGWSVVRAQDFILSLLYLIDNFDSFASQLPTNTYSEAFLYDIAVLSHEQMLSNGGDWKSYFDTPAFPTNVTCNPEPCNMMTHGVNVQQAIKSEAVWYRFSQDMTDIASTFIRVSKLDTYHGAPSGVVQADEHLAGFMPSHGTELCGVVEAMFSYEVCGDILGDPFFYERAERIAYNALPATLTKDMWAHQYLQQANEMNAAVVDPHVWVTDGPDSTLFGLAPNYGCCTANYHQGWPKFVQRLVKATPTGGVSVSMWGPVTATVPLPNNAAARVTVTTDYPFGDVATIDVVGPVNLPIQFRVPSWATGATMAVNGGAAVNIGASNGTFYTVTGTNTSTSIVVHFNPFIRIEQRYNGAVSIFRGGLLYGMHIGENFTTLETYAFQSADYSVSPTTSWNVAVLLSDITNPGASLTFTQLSPPGLVPYNATTPPVTITGQGRLVNGWGEAANAAGAPPLSPACGVVGECGDLIPVTFVPFGSTHLRISEMPYTTA